MSELTSTSWSSINPWQHHPRRHERNGGTVRNIPLQPPRDWLSPACTRGPPSWSCSRKGLGPSSTQVFSSTRASLWFCHRKRVCLFRSPCSSRAQWLGWLWFRWGTFWSIRKRSKRFRLPIATYLHSQHMERVSRMMSRQYGESYMSVDGWRAREERR